MSAVATDALLADLAGAGEVLVDPDLLASYRADQAAPGLLPAGTPVAVVRPTSTAEVQAAVRAAAARDPRRSRGAGSGLSGGANAIDGGLVVSLERMTRILEIDAAGLTATVEPGVVNATLGAAAAAEGLWYAPDPASREFSTIGGNVATNSRQAVLREVRGHPRRAAVLRARPGRRPRRAGRAPHPQGRRRPRPGGPRLRVGGRSGSSPRSPSSCCRRRRAPARWPPRSRRSSTAGVAVAAIVRRVRPSMLELLDRTTLQAVQELEPLGYEDDVRPCSSPDRTRAPTPARARSR